MIVGIDVEAAALGNAGISRYVTCLVHEFLCNPQEIKELHLFAPRKVTGFDHPLVHWHIHGKSPRTWRIALLLSHLGLARPLAGAPFLDVYHAPDLVFPRQEHASWTTVVTVHDLTTITHFRTHGLVHSLSTWLFMKILSLCGHSIIVPSQHVANQVRGRMSKQRQTIHVIPESANVGSEQAFGGQTGNSSA